VKCPRDDCKFAVDRGVGSPICLPFGNVSLDVFSSKFCGTNLTERWQDVALQPGADIINA